MGLPVHLVCGYKLEESCWNSHMQLEFCVLSVVKGGLHNVFSLCYHSQVLCEWVNNFLNFVSL